MVICAMPTIKKLAHFTPMVNTSLGRGWSARNQFGKAFDKTYHFHTANPVEDYDDRVALYLVYVMSLAFRGSNLCADDLT